MKIRISFSTINELFPIQGYGLTRFSKTEKATYLKSGIWKIDEIGFEKGTQFRKQRVDL